MVDNNLAQREQLVKLESRMDKMTDQAAGWGSCYKETWLLAKLLRDQIEKQIANMTQLMTNFALACFRRVSTTFQGGSLKRGQLQSGKPPLNQ